MPKLIITIEEKAEHMENETLVGFGITQDMDWDGADKSLPPAMGPILVELVLKAVTLMQQQSGGCLHKADTSDRSIPLECHMADMKAELDQPFPAEL